MNRPLLVTCTFIICFLSSLAPLHAQSAPASQPADPLVGWFKLPDSGPLIPILKVDNTYFTVCLGFEIPLKPCPAGLEWALAPSTMEGTKLTFDPSSSAHSLTICDVAEANNNDNSLSGQPRSVTKVDKPAGLLDPTAPAPRTLSDFVGLYYPIYAPGMRFEIRKDANGYLSSLQYFHSGQWSSREESRQLELLPDQLGFSNLDHKHTVQFIYNSALKRYEITRTQAASVIRMPLARITDPAAGPDPSRNTRIGIPSWH